MKHELAHLHEEWLNGTLIVRIEGEIDASNVLVIGDRLRSLLTNRAIAMVLDLSATTYLDSAGLNLLFVLAEELRAHQQRFVLVVGEASPVRRVIDLTGVGVVAPMHASMDEAVSVICEPS